MAEFKIGDVVQLKSGGPKMTITGRTTGWEKASTTDWNCTWFDNGTQKWGDFHQDTLEAVNSNTVIPPK
jgi:uncharacterized protein YodC (DUF2158 family)